MMILTAFSNPSVLAFGLPGNGEWLILLVLGLLIFGRRLPEVGRSVGRSIVEFKKGIKGIEDDVEEESSRPARPGKLDQQSVERIEKQPEAPPIESSAPPKETVATADSDKSEG